MANDLQRMQQAQVKQLRKDARKLDTIAKHLRAQAKEIAQEMKSAERADKARTNFYSKKSKVDGETVLTPDLPDPQPRPIDYTTPGDSDITPEDLPF